MRCPSQTELTRFRWPGHIALLHLEIRAHGLHQRPQVEVLGLRLYLLNGFFKCWDMECRDYRTTQLEYRQDLVVPPAQRDFSIFSHHCHDGS